MNSREPAGGAMAGQTRSKSIAKSHQTDDAAKGGRGIDTKHARVSMCWKKEGAFQGMDRPTFSTSPSNYKDSPFPNTHSF